MTVRAVFAQEQGITFENSDWISVLSKARSTGKLIFVDVFTDWCAPCRQMDNEVFPQEIAGKFFNEHFINFKIDAEKGEGRKFAEKYAVRSYPNYLFINGEGAPVYRMLGAMKTSELIQHAKNAIEEAKVPETVFNMERVYPQNNTDKDFMYRYLTRLTKLRLHTSELLNEYVGLLSTEERSHPKNIKLIADNGSWFNRKLSFGLAMDVLEGHRAVFEQLRNEKQVNETLENIRRNVMNTSLDKAIASRDTALLGKVLQVKDNFQLNYFDNKQTAMLKYLYRTGDQEAYKRQATDFIENNLLRIHRDTLLAHDLASFNSVKSHFLKEGTPLPESEEKSYQYTQTVQLSGTLISIVENFLKLPLTRLEKRKALSWVTIALKIADMDAEYFKNARPHYEMVQAMALYKAGSSKQALSGLQGLLEKYADNPQATAHITGIMQRMKGGKEL